MGQEGHFFFIRRADRVFYEHPFVSRTFSAVSNAARVETTTPTSRFFVRNETVLALGIVLIELCYGQPLDQLRVPADSCGDPTPGIASDLRTAERLANVLDEEAGPDYAMPAR